MTTGTITERRAGRVPEQEPLGALGRWAARCDDHRRAVLLAWILLIIGVTALSG